MRTVLQVVPHATSQNEVFAVFVLNVMQSLGSIILPKKLKNCFILSIHPKT
ncbi:hypothetical protein THF5H11_180042 [Vibrio jasicida]|nr:hypothetical protein THF5H11_180042 [Vibrio jasicida]CAH1609259.1 hypothetical protein THF5G08_80284 [Vibrio jasicida]